MQKFKSLLIALIMISMTHSMNYQGYLGEVPASMLTSQATEISQFGTGFDEYIVVDGTDGLDEPRDLEFHPGANRSDELWVVNRIDDSMIIVHDTGLANQTVEERLDSHRYHFMEEVSAIAFGSYHPEFDYQFGTAQESRNTYNNQASPNDFMGPALWPSSLDHFAREHQNDSLLGSHIDMLHESPLGMGMAHDSGNAYWYFDGFYGNLVYYDFQMDHDTGMDDHSDGIVRRHSDIQLSRYPGVPGHMELDHDTGILYIADTGNNRVLWVDTLDTTVNVTSMMDDPSRLEPLQEYSRVLDREYGVLATGISRASGIAIENGNLFVSSNGNGSISAFNLSADGKSGELTEVVQTSANSIMGLEIGHDSKLYYVDAGNDTVVRLDVIDDMDKDRIRDSLDNCAAVSNPSQADYDLDMIGDACDDDLDNDGVLNMDDDCETGSIGWTSSSSTDHDSDGCRDSTEDSDDDNDSIDDYLDACPLGEAGVISNAQSDYDSDGCIDSTEDDDDDADGVIDSTDDCLRSPLEFQSNSASDIDGDGCQDSGEDLDDDADGFEDSIDLCPVESGNSSLGTFLGCIDADGDGWADVEDVYPQNGTQWSDSDEDGFGDSPVGDFADSCPSLSGTSTIDRYGCIDSDGDGYSNPYGQHTVQDGADAFPNDETQWFDLDDDGFGDNPDGLNSDDCINQSGTSREGGILGCTDSDSDGWADSIDAFPNEPTQWSDADGDGFGDEIGGLEGDSCPSESGNSSEDRFGCLDSDMDGYSDLGDSFPNSASAWSDADSDSFPDQRGLLNSDDCPNEAGTSIEDRIGCLDTDGDGWSDENDAYPTDSTRSQALSVANTNVLILGIVLVVSLIFTGLFVRKGRSKPEDLKSVIPIQNVAISQVPTGPPIPEEGLPAGWTVEQWQYYGQDYLDRQK